MSDTSTKRMIRAYNQLSTVTMFLSGMFISPPENLYNSEKVEIDIQRHDEEVSIAITDLASGYRHNSGELFTNKEFLPPVHKESFGLNVFDLLKRMAGQNPFADVNFQANAIVKFFSGARKVEEKIMRAMEEQAAQVLTKGTVTLKDAAGLSLYTIDYKPKATHFPTAGVVWGVASDDPIGDLQSLCEVIQTDGLLRPNLAIMGEASFVEFLKDDNVQKHFDTRRVDQGSILPMRLDDSGGIFRGHVEVGNYRLEVWTYNSRFKEIDTGTSLPYIPNGKVVIRATSGRLDATFGAIPSILPPDQRLLSLLPPRISDRAVGRDLFTNVWTDPQGENIFGGLSSRPLYIPTAIDSFGCLDTGL